MTHSARHARVVLTIVPSNGTGISSRFFPSYPPLGLCYLAAVLRRDGCDVVIVDLQHQTSEELAAVVRRHAPDLVGVSASMPMLQPTLALAQSIRSWAPHAQLIVGGPLVAHFAGELVGPNFFDVAVRGEAEHLIGRLAEWVVTGAGVPPKLPGTTVRDGGVCIDIPAEAPIADLDTIPPPARDLLRRESLFLFHPLLGSYGPATTVLTTRGCRYACSFCYQYPFKNFIRSHSADYVVDEIDWLAKRYGVTCVRFIDDLFTVDRERTLALCEALARRHPGLSWQCGTRTDLVDRELLAIMRRAGCRVINFGLETDHRPDLSKIGKGGQHDPLELVRVAAEEGLSVIGQFILGFPWDTPRTIARRVRVAMALPISGATFWPLIPFPGTRLHSEAVASHGEFDANFVQNTCADSPSILTHPVYSPPGMTRGQLRQAVVAAHVAFYARPRIWVPLAKHTTAYARTTWEARNVSST